MAARRRGRSSSPSTSPSASPPPKKGVASRSRRSAPSSPSSSSSKSSPSRSESPSPRSKRLQRARELLSRVPPDKEFSKNEKEQERLKTRGKDKENSKNQAQDKASDKGKERDDNRRKPNDDSRDIKGRDDSRGRSRDDNRGKARDDIRGRARDSDGEKEKGAHTIIERDNRESKTRNDDRMKNRDRIRDDYRGKERVKDDNRNQERVKDDSRNRISDRSKGGGKDDTRNKDGDRKRVRTDAKDTDDHDDPRHKKEKSAREHDNRRHRSSSPMDSGRRQNRRLDGENARPRDQEEDASDKDPTRPGEDSLEQMKVAEAALEAKSKSKEKPSFEYTGKLAAETNKIKGITLQFTEPPEARNPTIRWRLYVFKDGEPLSDPLYIHRQSCYLFGRERRIADIPTDHPSCSKQHAVIQYRLVEKEGEDGMASSKVQPYLMDLNSTNGTSLNGERIEPQRYYELFEKDTVKFGNSSREYVLLHEHSAG